jgi:hypothetical protein
LHDIVNSELRQKLRALQGADPQQPHQFEQATGVDPERDVDRVLAFTTAQASAPPSGSPTILASGRFDTVRIEGFIRERGGAVEEYKGKRILTDAEGKTTVAFVEPGLIAVGTTAGVKAAIDTKTSAGATVRDNQDLMRQLKSVDDGNAWAVSRFDGIPAGTPIPAAIAGQLPAISWLAVSGHVDGGLRGTLRAEARDDTAAKDLRDVVRGFLALARLQGGQHAEFTEIVNSLEMGGDGKTVTVDFAVPSSAIAAISALPRRRPDGLTPGGPSAVPPVSPRVPAPVPGI